MYDRPTIPSRPLERSDIERIRDHPDVESAISLGTASLDDRPYHESDPVEQLVVLAEGTVFGFEYTELGWSCEIVETGATRRDHLRCAIDWQNEH